MDDLGWTPLSINLEGDGAFEDWKDKSPAHGRLTRLAALPGGMASGRPSIALGIELDDGTVVVAETSWNLLFTAAKAVEARYGPAVD
jgi:hypothetical protein